MKSVRFVSALFAIMMVGVVCAQDKAWPWDFPQGIKIEAEPGQKILTCQSFYFDKVKSNDDLTKSVLIWYDREMEQVGAEKSDIGRSDKQLVPNALIIPLKKGQKAKKGDVVLTSVDGAKVNRMWRTNGGVQYLQVLNRLFVAILAYGFNSGAYCTEIFRAGIQGIDPGQTEAGRSLGLSQWQTIFKIVLPQAVKAVLPTYTSEFIVLIKETSVASFIAVMDMTKAGDMIRNATYNAWIPLLTCAAIYLVLTVGLTKLFGLLEKRMAKSDRS